MSMWQPEVDEALNNVNQLIQGKEYQVQDSEEGWILALVDMETLDMVFVGFEYSTSTLLDVLRVVEFHLNNA